MRNDAEQEHGKRAMPEKHNPRDKLTELVADIYATIAEPTLFAMRLANALGVRFGRKLEGKASGKYKGARKLMRQRYGVRM